jgi:SPP1 family predicted phage head-tail adaptor
MPASIAAGRLNRRIKIQAQSTTQDEVGQPVQTWNTVYSCWASVANVSGSLIYATAGFVSKISHQIALRWTSSVVIAANQRVFYTEPTTGVQHTYEIEAVLNTDQANKEIVLLAYELSGQE